MSHEYQLLRVSFLYSDGGVVNGGFVPDYSVVDETTDYSKTVIKRDFDKGEKTLFPFLPQVF